jgi:glucan 1,3-beta-glucosidase
MLTGIGMRRGWSIIRCINSTSPGLNLWWLDSSRQRHRKHQLTKKDNPLTVCRYYQPIPDAAHSPYPRNAALNDPDYSSCLGRGYCNALGLRVLDSKGITIYGAGLYSFFHHYSTACSDGEGAVNCQGEIFSLEGSSSMDLYLLSTVGTTNMIVRDGESLARYDDNLATYAQTIAYFTE